MFEETRKYVKSLGLPEGDLFDMPSSTLRFPDGAAFRIEVPTVNTAESVAALLETATKNGIVVNRVTETYGIVPSQPRKKSRNIAACVTTTAANCLLSVGPRATYDTGATVLSSQGVRISLSFTRYGTGTARDWKILSA